MSGNYDVTNVATRNGVDNSSSFRTGRNGKKVFIGTDWNETAHITNDANQGTIFQEGQGMTLKLNSRYKNGGPDTYANLDGRHTGISFDLLDKFIEAAASGVLEDIDHKGYTRENMAAFGREFDKLRSEKLAEAKRDPYNKKYTKMMNGAEFTFSAQELERLYKAAGFDLAQKNTTVTQPNPVAEEVTEVVPPAVDEVPPTPPQGQVNQVPEMQSSTPPHKHGDVTDVDVPDGNERISHNGQAIVNEITRLLGLPDGEVEIKFDGDALCYENDVLIYAEGTYTYNGQTKKFRIDRSGETEKVQTKETGAFRRWHDVEVPQRPQARAAARRGHVGSMEATTAVVTDTAIADDEQARLQQYYKENVTDQQYWNGRICVEDDANDPNQFHGSYDQVTSNDGRRLARVSTYNTETHQTEVKYYEVKAVNIHSQYGENRVYPQIIPDLSKEVTDAEF
ncbi:MAG: hypothetical protein K6E29_00040 [Cyanobacteria bacterium RUI128]|nr:hypothetical protein [Cyanobacteria bacterium RUI128]